LNPGKSGGLGDPLQSGTVVAGHTGAASPEELFAIDDSGSSMLAMLAMLAILAMSAM
jgi:hypothetical protein